jgi:hypothetical protein
MALALVSVALVALVVMDVSSRGGRPSRDSILVCLSGLTRVFENARNPSWAPCSPPGLPTLCSRSGVGAGSSEYAPFPCCWHSRPFV